MGYKTTKMFKALGTVNRIDAEPAEDIGREQLSAAVNDAAKMVRKMHSELTVFEADSEISKINENAGVKAVEVSKETVRLIASAKEYSKITDGDFSVTVRPLTKLWGIGPQTGCVPKSEDIEIAARLVGDGDIMISGRKVMLRRKGQAMDLGSIAKGRAADRAACILKDNKIEKATINFGGTVWVIGHEENVGIQNPFAKTGKYLGEISVSNKAVVTSGSYERFFIKDGRRYAHIIDPHTGYPAQTDICSVTLIGDSAEQLDALSTAMFVRGLEGAAKLAAKHNTEAVFITTDGNVIATNGLKGIFRMNNAKN